MIEEKHLQTDEYAGETQPHFFKQSKWLFIGFLVMLAGFLIGLVCSITS
jgi:hypothetical protein